MYKLSEIISTPIISLFECEHQGIVSNLFFDTKLKKCRYAQILDENENTIKNININNLYLIGEHCIFIKNEACVDYHINHPQTNDSIQTLLHLKIYDTIGNFYGTTKDITLDKNFNIESIELDNNKIIDKNEIYNIGKSIILLNKNNLNLNKFRPKQKIKVDQNSNKKVVILNKSESKNHCTPNKICTINKITTDSNFLIGRIITQNITAYNGELIAKNGLSITKEIITKASLYGKLFELTRYSK